MEKIDDGLKALLESGKEKGYLTYSQVNDHLPDDDANPEKIDQLLILLEDQGIELIDESEAEEREGGGPVLDDEARAELDISFLDEEESRRIDDPVRMYLTQMGEIPLLKREQEIALAKKIEVTRKRFRRKVLECDGALVQVVEQRREGAIELAELLDVEVEILVVRVVIGVRHLDEADAVFEQLDLCGLRSFEPGHAALEHSLG